MSVMDMQGDKALEASVTNCKPDLAMAWSICGLLLASAAAALKALLSSVEITFTTWNVSKTAAVWCVLGWKGLVPSPAVQPIMFPSLPEQSRVS
jgi:hypothetical protein